MIPATTTNFNFVKRLRRNRKSESIREILQETRLHPSHLIAPLFLVEGENKKEKIASLPNVYRFSIDLALKEISDLKERGIQGFSLFPALDPHLKSLEAEEAYHENNLICRAIRTIKNKIPDLCLIADVALDPYTTHGHDGLTNDHGEVLNDETIHVLIQMSLVFAKAGIDYLAPSDMMDGRVGAIRKALDQNGYHQVGLLAYSAKFSSSLYYPFRDAIQTKLAFGNKKSYQLNPSNRREALEEALMDESEGADILMVKPATLYLDLIWQIKEKTNLPIAAYHVSGEYAMVVAAHQKGWLNAPAVFYETLLCIKRAGADFIFTYAIRSVLPYL